MSTDRTTEILNYLSAISRDVGELRTEVHSLRDEMSARFSEVNTRMDRIETEVTRLGREQRLLNRIGSVMLETRADIEELQERVDVLEGK
ncbi:MAG TPA: hypothetical protein VGB76_01205 [Pyrinomonadaceae bacterium]|jgi:DNA repair exonuclease SbcCD ATPase subunit